MVRILWVTNIGAEKDWEVDYIKSILKYCKFEYTIETVTDINLIVPNALIIVNHSVNYMSYLYKYEVSNTPFGVIHLSDEWFNDDVRFYDFRMCQFAFRNYYSDHFERYPKLNFLALSFKNGFWKNYNGPAPLEITYKDRAYEWSFAGAPRSIKRQNTLKLFESVKPNKVHFEIGNSFSSPKTGLSTNEYRSLLLNTKYGLCAIGISNTLAGDTGRVTETLETGGVPIVLAGRNSKGVTYWRSLYGEEPPFIIGENWEECLNRVIALSPEEYENIRVACFTFWENYKKRLGSCLTELVTTKLQY